MTSEKKSSSETLNLHRQVGEVLVNGIDISSAAFKETAHQFYQEKQANEPVTLIYQGTVATEWLVTSYQDVKKLLKDPRLVKNPTAVFPKEQVPKILPDELLAHMSTFMFQADCNEHQFLRSFVKKPFSFNMIEKLTADIQAISTQLLTNRTGTEIFHFVEEYARLIPIYTMSELLGIPKKDREQFKSWIDLLLTQPDLIKDQSTTHKNELANFFAYLQKLIITKQTEPADDLVSHLVSTQKDGQSLAPKELFAMISLLIATGYKPVEYLITNTLIALLENPTTFAQVKTDNILITQTIEETLRFYPPGEVATSRWAIDDFVLHGKQIKRGDKVTLGLAAANRDATIFAQPDQFNIYRETNPHLAFGPGPHGCIGSHLARLEAKIAICTFIQQFPSIELAIPRDEIKWQAHYALRYIDELPLKINVK